MENSTDPKRDINVVQSSEGSGTTIAIIVAALALVVGGFLFFGNNSNTPVEGPKVTQNNTTLPAPVIEVPADPAPVEPPAAQSTTPPAAAPATNP